MYSSEFDTFIQKFKDLWHSGVDAHLDVHTHAGQAWVSLHVRLGHAPGPLHPQVHPHFPPTPRSKNSSSRQRRRARRAAARRKQAEEASNAATENVETIVVGNEAEKANPDDVVDQSKGAEVAAVDVPVKGVDDEFCPDDEYHEVENIAETAFRCLQCRMLFLPVLHSEENDIANYESCSRHIGVKRCENCAFVLVGLARIRCHRQVCHYSA